MLSTVKTTNLDAVNVLDILNYYPPASYSAVSGLVLPDFVKYGLERKDVCFYRVKRLSFDEDFPRREAFENVLLSLDSSAFNFVYVLSGNERGIELYFGIVKNANADNDAGGQRLTANDYGALLEGAFAGNFGGSEVERVKGEDLDKCILSASNKYDSAGMIVGVPSETGQDDSGKGFQGMDRLINSMLGLNWQIIVVAEPADRKDIAAWQQEICSIYNAVAPLGRSSAQWSSSSGVTHTEGVSDSDAKSANYSKGEGKSGGSSSGGSSSSTNSGWSNNESFGKSKSHTHGTSSSDASNQGRSRSMTAEIINKNAQEMLKYIDEELLNRIKCGFGRGMFKTSVYYMADNPSTANRLRVGVISLFQGDSSNYSPLTAYKLDLAGSRSARLAVKSFQNISSANNENEPNQLALLSRPHNNGFVGLNTWLTAGEVSLLAGLPQKEIPGLSVVEGVDFGLNVAAEGEITLGCLIQKGRRLDKMPLRLSKDFVNKHTFIAGVTGSGKTTTCHKLLMEAGAPFLVIEPAKTEYRPLIGIKEFGNCVVFTVGDEETAPLRFNPFELIKGEILTSHIDMLKASFTSAFPMEGSMPQLLEEAIYKCYEDKGWNVDTGRNEALAARDDYKEGDEFTDKYDAFPILSDFLNSLRAVVAAKNFGARLNDEYLGSLVSRFSNLRKGAKGRMLNTQHSVDFAKIAEKNVIIELENLKSAEDKALVMGLILARLSAVIKEKHRNNHKYRHITLVEEAHRLLSKVEFGDSGAKKGAVETFTDLLAEVRKYGEGLIIVDQIPNKLASEVIKNTNTKIIHKILARDDKETVGDAMLMDAKQKTFLSALETGEAVVFTEGLLKPVHVAIQRAIDTNGAEIDTNKAEISDSKVREEYLSWMERTHPRILAENSVINELYTEFNRQLNLCLNQSDRSEIKTGKGLMTEFSLRIAEFRENYKYDTEALPSDTLSSGNICRLLAKEKIKRMLADNILYERLVQFAERHLLGNTDIKELEDAPFGNLKRVITTIGMNV